MLYRAEGPGTEPNFGLLHCYAGSASHKPPACDAAPKNVTTTSNAHFALDALSPEKHVPSRRGKGAVRHT